jgi:hypothetical protein
VLTLTGVAHRPAPAASQPLVPAPRHNHHPCGAPLDEASTRVQNLHPSDLPLACDPQMERDVLGLSLGLRTPRLLAAHAGAGTGHRARTWINALHHRLSLQSCVDLSIRATSRRTRRTRSLDGRAVSRFGSIRHTETEKPSALRRPLSPSNRRRAHDAVVNNSICVDQMRDPHSPGPRTACGRCSALANASDASTSAGSRSMSNPPPSSASVLSH